MFAVENIHKSYKTVSSPLHVLKGVGFRITEGEFVCIVGPSGAGKSTLLHIMGGLDAPDEGRVELNGQDLYRINEKKRAHVRNRGIGFVFQFYHLLPEFNALENVLMPALVEKNFNSLKEHEKRAAELLTQVGLKERLTHKPQELSGGEQQRVAIARALMNEPKVLMCDEPTGNLDSVTGKEIMELLYALNKKNQQTLVVITHDEEIANMSDRVIHMRDGRLSNEK